jgi:hypothetical protein
MPGVCNPWQRELAAAGNAAVEMTHWEASMVRDSVLAVILLWSCAGWAGDKVQPLDVKLGLWEVTTTNTMSGMPPIPPETLARMTPEQRARMEESMKKGMGGGPKTTTRKECVTQEKLNKDYLFGEERKNCSRTVVTASSSKTEIKMQCQEEKMKMDGTFLMEAVSSDHVKGSMQMVASGSGQSMNVNVDFNARYVGPVCGDTK